MSAIEEALERSGKRADLGNALAVADISMKPAEFVAMVAVVAAVVGLVGLALAGLVRRSPRDACLFRCPFLRSSNRVEATVSLRRSATDVLQLVTTALRSGFGLTEDGVGRRGRRRTGARVADVLAEVRLGRDLWSR